MSASSSLQPETQLRITVRLPGSTLMGWVMGGRHIVDMRFRSGYAMLTQYFRRGSISARIETFRTRNLGSGLTSVDDEDGWSAMLAAPAQSGAAYDGAGQRCCISRATRRRRPAWACLQTNRPRSCR